jgi:hypothetical protein
MTQRRHMDYIAILRLHVATLAFRTEYAVSGAKANYPDFESGTGVKTPHDIMHHMINLTKGPDDLFSGRKFSPTEKIDWDNSIQQLRDYSAALDKTLLKLKDPDEQLLKTVYQGPMCDAMTHVGQLMTLRRLSGDPLAGLHFMKVDIEIGKLDYSGYFQ